MRSGEDEGTSGSAPAPDEVAHRRALQEEEYRLPHHWILRKHGLHNYLHKSDVMADLVRASGLTGGAALDVGCGDGRVLAAAGRLGFTRLAGIDHDPGLVEAARARLGSSASIRLGDARTTPIDDEVGTVYLFNPLDEEGVADVAAELAASLSRRPRPALVVYVNPRAVAPLLDAGLSMVHLEPQFCVLAT
ncbi:MAG: class I SAM-dependent methyltransferase [Acidimicrobiales bacterium]|nr:class I SAM-dependent methyltransferase [Acidimicrobiales bacterium]